MVSKLEFREDSRLAAKSGAFPASLKRQKELEKLPAILRRYEPPRIRAKALDGYILRRARERGRAYLDPDDEAFIEDEWASLYYVMLDGLSPRTREVFRLYYVKQLKLRAIARRLDITVRTARADLKRALKVIAREQEQLEREGVVEKGP